MAATGSEAAVTGVEVGEDFRDSCSLCMEPYRGRNPKILPCFHTFCLPCLSALTESAAAEKPEQDDKTKGGVEGQPKPDDFGETEGREKDGAGGSEGRGSDVNRCHRDGTKGAVFLCPTCRAPVTVPEGGVAALQTNFYIATETRETTTQPYLCDLCEEGDAKEATHACDKCRQRMCRACRRLHDKVVDPREHPVRALNVHEMAPKKAETRKWCAVHRDQELCFHCKDCDVSICLHCKLTSHQPHVTEDMAAATLRGKEELMKLEATAKEQTEAVEMSLIRLSRDSKELSRQRQEVTEELGALRRNSPMGQQCT